MAVNSWFYRFDAWLDEHFGYMNWPDVNIELTPEEQNALLSKSPRLSYPAKKRKDENGEG